VCDNGKCNCVNNFSGPTCSTNTEEILPITNGTQVKVSSLSDNLLFSLNLKEIAELDVSGKVVSNYSLNLQNLSASVVTGSDGTRNWTYTIHFPNGAYMLLNFTFTSATPLSVSFANTSLTLQPNSIKLTFQVVNWQFQTIKNELRVTLNFSSETHDQCSTLNSVADTSGNLRWVELTVGDYSLYGSFLNVAEVDGKVRSMQINSIDSSVLSFILPHFWVTAIVDPDFSVLLGKPTSSNTKSTCEQDEQKRGGTGESKAGLIAGLITGVAALAVIVAGTIALRRRRQLTRQRLHVSSVPRT